MADWKLQARAVVKLQRDRNMFVFIFVFMPLLKFLANLFRRNHMVTYPQIFDFIHVSQLPKMSQVRK